MREPTRHASSRRSLASPLGLTLAVERLAKRPACFCALPSADVARRPGRRARQPVAPQHSALRCSTSLPRARAPATRRVRRVDGASAAARAWRWRPAAVTDCRHWLLRARAPLHRSARHRRVGLTTARRRAARHHLVRGRPRRRRAAARAPGSPAGSAVARWRKTCRAGRRPISARRARARARSRLPGSVARGVCRRAALAAVRASYVSSNCARRCKRLESFPAVGAPVRRDRSCTDLI